MSVGAAVCPTWITQGVADAKLVSIAGLDGQRPVCPYVFQLAWMSS